MRLVMHEHPMLTTCVNDTVYKSIEGVLRNDEIESLQGANKGRGVLESSNFNVQVFIFQTSNFIRKCEERFYMKRCRSDPC